MDRWIDSGHVAPWLARSNALIFLFKWVPTYSIKLIQFLFEISSLTNTYYLCYLLFTWVASTIGSGVFSSIFFFPTLMICYHYRYVNKLRLGSHYPVWKMYNWSRSILRFQSLCGFRASVNLWGSNLPRQNLPDLA